MCLYTHLEINSSRRNMEMKRIYQLYILQQELELIYAIPTRGPIVGDDFFSTVLALNFDMCTYHFQSRLTHIYPL